MNRKFIVMAASALLLTGCAKDAFVDGTESQPTSELQEINLSVAQPQNVTMETRGMGMVGGLADTDANKWTNQIIKVYALRADTEPYLNGKEAKVTSEGPNKATIAWVEEPIQYYPMQGAYKFFGVYVDDATLNAAEPAADGSVTMDVTYNGTQDIMIADAALTAADKKTLAQSINLGDKVGDDGEFVEGATDEEKAKINAEYNKAFSAYAARRSVQPELVFKHQLAHLNFYVKAGNKAAAMEMNTEQITKGVYINAVTVKDVANKAAIAVSPATGISFTPSTSDKADFTLYQEYVENEQVNKPLKNTASTWNEQTSAAEKVLVGQGMLVTAGVTQYLADVKVYEPIDQTYQNVPADQQYKEYQDVVISCKDSEGNPIAFEAGKTYDVTITVYSKEQIQITATLTGWQNGGSIEVSPEDDIFQN